VPAHTDVTDEAMVAATFELTAKKFGRIDCVVANAGIQVICPIQDFSFKDYRRLVCFVRSLSSFVLTS
jgi:3-hydroxybutyrate dehydrogenase